MVSQQRAAQSKTRAAVGGFGVALLGAALSVVAALPVVFLLDALSSLVGFAALFVASYVGRPPW
jgi:hypothetical protein